MAFTEAVTILKDPTTGKEITIESACTDKKHLHEERSRTAGRTQVESVSRRYSRDSNKCRSDLSSAGGRTQSSRRSERCDGRCRCENRPKGCPTPQSPQECCCCCCCHGPAPPTVAMARPIPQPPLPVAHLTPQVTSAIPNLSMSQPNVASVVTMAQPPAFMPHPMQLQQPIAAPARAHQLIPIHKIKKGGHHADRAPITLPQNVTVMTAGGYPISSPYGIANSSNGFAPMPVIMGVSSATSPTNGSFGNGSFGNGSYGNGSFGNTQMTLSIPGRGAVHIPCFLAQ